MKRFFFFFLVCPFLFPGNLLLGSSTELTKEERWKASYVLTTLIESEKALVNGNEVPFEKAPAARNARVNALQVVRNASGIPNYRYVYDRLGLSKDQKDSGTPKWFGLSWDHHPNAYKVCNATRHMLGAVANRDYLVLRDTHGNLESRLQAGYQQLGKVAQSLSGQKNDPRVSCKKLLALGEPFIKEQMGR